MYCDTLILFARFCIIFGTTVFGHFHPHASLKKKSKKKKPLKNNNNNEAKKKKKGKQKMK